MRLGWTRPASGLRQIDTDGSVFAATPASLSLDLKWPARYQTWCSLPVRWPRCRGTASCCAPMSSAGRVGPGFRGVHPLTAWREYRDITQADLASRPAVARDLIAQIETHKKQGSVTSLDRLARTLGVPIEALIAERG